MQLDDLITKVSRLPLSRQQEVIDFVTFLEQRYGTEKKPEHSDWPENHFELMSIDQAMRNLEDEPEIYSDEDLKERWQ